MRKATVFLLIIICILMTLGMAAAVTPVSFVVSTGAWQIQEGETIHPEYLDYTSDPKVGTGLTLADFTVSYGCSEQPRLFTFGEDGSITMGMMSGTASPGAVTVVASYTPIKSGRGTPFIVKYTLHYYKMLTSFEYTERIPYSDLGLTQTDIFKVTKTAGTKRQVIATSSDPTGLSVNVQSWNFSGTFKVTVTPHRIGTYTVLLDAGYGFTKTLTYTVHPDPEFITTAQDFYEVRQGDTIQLGVDTGDGWSNTVEVTAHIQYGNLGIFANKANEFTGTKTGLTYYQLRTFNYKRCSFTMRVLNPESTGVQLPATLKAAVSETSDLPLVVKDASGNEVLTHMEIIEGQDCATLIYQPRTGRCYLRGQKAGKAIVRAYGTDGSTADTEVQILPPAESVTLDHSEITLYPGQSLQLNAIVPEGTWSEFTWNHAYDKWNSAPFSMVDGMIRAYFAGSGTVTVYADCGTASASCKVTVLDGPGVLHIEGLPENLAIGEQVQLTVVDREGNPCPWPYEFYVPYPESGQCASLTADGILTGVNISNDLQIAARFLLDGYAISAARKVHTVIAPRKLSYAAGSITLAINSTATLGKVICDVGQLNSKWFTVTVEDPQVLTFRENTLYPLQEDTTALIVTPKYGDCEPLRIPVTITAADQTMYLSGTSSYDNLVYKGETVPLPQLTDWYGNPIPTTYEIADQYHIGGQAKPFTLNTTAGTLKCNYGNAYCRLRLTTEDGRTGLVTYVGIVRTARISFQQTDVTQWVGSKWTAVLEAAPGSSYANFCPRDMTITVTSQATGRTVTLTEDDYVYKYDEGLISISGTSLVEDVITINARMSTGLQASCTVTIIPNYHCTNDGHKWVEDPAVAPTMISAGLTQGSHCSTCHMVQTAQREVAPLGSIALNVTSVSLSLCQGMDTFTLKAWVAQDEEDTTLPLWYSSDTDVVKVKRGRLTATGVGHALILVMIGDCEPRLVQITVSEAPIALTLPASLREIGEQAFRGSRAMYVIVPDGVTSIGPGAFMDCTGLRTIVIPASVTSIAEDAFAGSSEVTIVGPEGSMAQRYAEAHDIPFTAN